MLACQDDLLIHPIIVEPRLDILTSATVEAKVGVLTKLRSNFRKPLELHVVKILLIH